MTNALGKWLIIAGCLIVFAGLVLFFAGNKLGWLGHLPGDIRIEREHFRFYFPITTMILVSIILSLIFTFASKIFKKFF